MSLSGCFEKLRHEIFTSKCEFMKVCMADGSYQPRPCDENPQGYCGKYRSLEKKKHAEQKL